MRRAIASRFLALPIAAALLPLQSTALACSACMGEANSKSGGAINGAIFLLLGCIGLVLSSLAAFAIYLLRRAG